MLSACGRTANSCAALKQIPCGDNNKILDIYQHKDYIQAAVDNTYIKHASLCAGSNGPQHPQSAHPSRSGGEWLRLTVLFQ